MIAAEKFRMAEVLALADFEEHAVWADFHEERDRARVLSWGVSRQALEAEIERYDYCGRSPLYPVLELRSADELANPSVALTFTTQQGEELPGYRLGQHAFGVFAEGAEFCLNPSLRSRARAELEKLAAALERDITDVQPLRYAAPSAWRDRLEEAGLGPVEGVLDLS